MKFQYKHTIYACYIGFVVQAIINNLSPLLFITFQKNFGIGIEKIGLLITLNFSIQILADILCARFADKLGYRATIIMAHVCSTIGLISMAILPFVFKNSFIGLVIAGVFNSIGGGIIEVLVSPIVEAAPPMREKSAAMSLLHSFYCWGHVAVVIFSTIGFGVFGMDRWYLLPLLWAIVPLCNTILFSFVPINRLVSDEEKIPVRKLFSLRLFWIFMLLMICAGASEQAMSQWASFFAEDGLKVSKTVGDLLGPCTFAIFMGSSRALYGKYGEKINLRSFIIYSCILCVLSYLVAVFSPWPIVSLFACSMCGLSVGIMWPGTFSLSMKACPQGGTAMFAFYAVTGDIGCCIGPGLVSLVSNHCTNNNIKIASKIFERFSESNGIRYGLLCALIFPVVLFITVYFGVRNRKIKQC